MDNQNYDEIEVDIKELIMVLLKKVWVIIIATIFCAIIAFAISKFRIEPKYESTTKLYLIANSDNQTVTYSDIQVGSQLTNDYMALVKSRPVLEDTISELNLDATTKELEDLISVSNPANTRIIEVTVKYSNPYTAKKIADKIRESSADHIENIMELKKINVVEEGNVPIEKVSPNITQNTLIGGILGAIISVLSILIVYFLNDTIKTPDDVERYLGLSVLASIPIQEGEVASKRKKAISKFMNKDKRITPKATRKPNTRSPRKG